MKIKLINEENRWDFEKQMNQGLKDIEKSGNKVIRILYRNFSKTKMPLTTSDSAYQVIVYEAIIEYE